MSYARIDGIKTALGTFSLIIWDEQSGRYEIGPNMGGTVAGEPWVTAFGVRYHVEIVFHIIDGDVCLKVPYRDDDHVTVGHETAWRSVDIRRVGDVMDKGSEAARKLVAGKILKTLADDFLARREERRAAGIAHATEDAERADEKAQKLLTEARALQDEARGHRERAETLRLGVAWVKAAVAGEAGQ